MALALLISDTHSFHRKIPKKHLPEADIIIHAGDISSMGRVNEVQDFLSWFSGLDQYAHKIFCVGNHDFLFEKNPDIAKSLIPANVTYLESSGVEVEGIKIHAECHQPEFHNWAFNVQRGEMYKYWDLVPDDTQLLISHSPPHGILDMCLNGDVVGCEELLTRMGELKQLRAVICGHIHEGRGIYRFADGQLVVNASLLNARYDLVNSPYLLDTDGWKIIS